MPKAPLVIEDSLLESQLIETLLAGLKVYRADLSYPQSHSDMQACVRGLLMTFDIKRKPIPDGLRYRCDACDGLGYLITKSEGHYREMQTCKTCDGRRYIKS